MAMRRVHVPLPPVRALSGRTVPDQVGLNDLLQAPLQLLQVMPPDTGVGKEKRKISDHRLQTIDFLIKCRKSVSSLSIVLSREIIGISI